VNAYGNLIVPDTRPDFFLYFNIPPDTIDVNIHPTKTEIKFENEQIIARYITSCVRESLGKTNMMPAIDFDSLPSFDIPPMPKGMEVTMPGIKVDPSFNPFKNDNSPNPRTESFGDKLSKIIPDMQMEPDVIQTGLNLNETSAVKQSFFQVAGKYIITQYGKGMICLHQQRAHMRILYEDFLQKESSGTSVSEKMLFPETITVASADYPLLQSMLPVLQRMGFDMDEFGKDTFVINGKPARIEDFNSESCIRGLLEVYKETGESHDKANTEIVAYALARTSCMKEIKVLTEKEMEYIFQSLFSCAQPSFSPAGKPVFFIMDENEFEKKFR
jgi:DNA mismatch repair protein MutL